MSKKIVIVLTDNGAIYWGEPVDGFSNCITLQNIQVKDQKCFPTKSGRLSIPIYRILEAIEVENTFQTTDQILDSFLKKFGDKKANDTDDPSISQEWLLNNH